MDIEKAILENEGLIYKLAHRFTKYACIDDLYQAGCVGIMKGFSNYDKSRNVKFSTYIYSYILGEMKSLIYKENTLKVSKDISSLRGRIFKASDKLTQILMREPTVKELCEFLEISEYNLAEALNSNVFSESLDSVVGNTSLMLHEIVSSPKINYDDLIYLKNRIISLEEPERSIMIERYYNDLTQREVAENLGLNQVDVSRKECKVLSKIKICN
ncbi:MAG: sigma-70 family RNA polymerase sigma factor [Bacilli bacterium]|nr:sigma-70 family RNA polymerase sigma factor [Bacilli bacterium]